MATFSFRKIILVEMQNTGFLVSRMNTGEIIQWSRQKKKNIVVWSYVMIINMKFGCESYLGDKKHRHGNGRGSGWRTGNIKMILSLLMVQLHKYWFLILEGPRRLLIAQLPTKSLSFWNLLGCLDKKRLRKQWDI